MLGRRATYGGASRSKIASMGCRVSLTCDRHPRVCGFYRSSPCLRILVKSTLTGSAGSSLEVRAVRVRAHWTVTGCDLSGINAAANQCRSFSNNGEVSERRSLAERSTGAPTTSFRFPTTPRPIRVGSLSRTPRYRLNGPRKTGGFLRSARDRIMATGGICRAARGVFRKCGESCVLERSWKPA